MTNADRIKKLSEEELSENLIRRIDWYFLLNPQEEMWVGDFYGVEHSKEDAIRAELEWLRKDGADDFYGLSNEACSYFNEYLKWVTGEWSANA